MDAMRKDPLVLVTYDGLEAGHPEIGDISRLAYLMANRDQGDYTLKAYAVSQGELVEVEWKADLGPYDESAWAIGEVTAEFPDGHIEQAIYRVDGAF